MTDRAALVAELEKARAAVHIYQTGMAGNAAAIGRLAMMKDAPGIDEAMVIANTHLRELAANCSAAETRRDEAERKLRAFDRHAAKESAELDIIDATAQRKVPLYNVDIEHRLREVEAKVAAWEAPEEDDEPWYDPAVCVPNGLAVIEVRLSVSGDVWRLTLEDDRYYDEWGGDYEASALGDGEFDGWRPVNELEESDEE